MASAAPAINQSALPLPGDVLVVKGTHWFSHLIEFAEGLDHLPEYSHVAVVSHMDDAGTVWCIEGRPGGVGYAAAMPYLHQSGTLVNMSQPIANEIRAQIATEAKKMLGTPYDWEGIEADAERDLNISGMWHESWQNTGLPPAHVVCSSFAAWLYRHFQVPSPMTTDTERIEPGDWAQFIEQHAW